MNDKRIIWADAVKGILILLVVLGHCIAATIGNEAANVDYWWCLIYSFHMPAFMAISGYFAFRSKVKKSVNVGKIIIRRFQQLMVPFFLWSIIKIGIEEGDISDFYKCILYPTNTFWFLWALFFIVVLFVFFDRLSQKLKVKQELIMGVLCLLCAAIMAILKDIRVLGIQYILYYFIFYCLGYYIHKYHVLIDKKWLIALMMLAWFVLGSFWRPRELPSFLPFTGNFAIIVRYVYKFIVAILAVLVMFNLAPIIMNGNRKFNKMLCKLGTVSLGVYTVHLTFTNFIVQVIQHYISLNTLVVLISFVVLVSFSYFVVFLLSKWKYTERLMLGKI